MNTKITKDLIKYLQPILNVNLSEEIFIEPERLEFGDVSLPVFSFAKILRKAPAEIAENFAEKINKITEQKKGSMVQKAEVANGYLNLFLDNNYLNKIIIQQILNPIKIKNKKKSGAIMLEYSQPNTHKEFHVGHLRNACLGQAWLIF